MTGKSSRYVLFILSSIACVLALQCAPEPAIKPTIKSETKTSDSTLMDLEFAKNFKVYTSSGDTIIEVTDGSRIWETKVSKLKSEGEIQFPLESLSCLSTSHLYYFSELGGLSKVSAVSYAENLKDEEVKAALVSGSLLDLTKGSSDYDAELVLELNPSIFTTYPFGDDEFERLQRAGIPTLHFTEYLETHPLGRAEWIKLAGFLLGETEKAEAYFSEVKKSYMVTKLKALTINAKRPTVINANGYANAWTAPSGNSLVAYFIKDAGGSYVFESDTASGNLTLDFERVYDLANSSDYWASVIFSDSVNINSFCGEEQRLAETRVMKEGRIFYCNAEKRDYFGKGMLQPHYILEDIYQIFNQDVEGYKPHYFESFRE
ncbi:MAG: ABC transporter substrate-binding protein [Flavobacteriales bacterium]